MQRQPCVCSDHQEPIGVDKAWPDIEIHDHDTDAMSEKHLRASALDVTVVWVDDVCICVTLDVEIIAQLQLEINAYSIRDSILSAPKLKLKSEAVHVESTTHLIVYALEDALKGKAVDLPLEIHRLEQALPEVAQTYRQQARIHTRACMIGHCGGIVLCGTRRDSRSHRSGLPRTRDLQNLGRR